MSRGYSGITWGLVIMVIGVLLLLDRLNVIYFDFGDFFNKWWPLILIIIGGNMILKRSNQPKKSSDN